MTTLRTEREADGLQESQQAIGSVDFSAETTAQVRAAADSSTRVEELILLASLGIDSINVALARNKATPTPVVASIVADVVTENVNIENVNAEPPPPIVDFVYDAALSNGKLSWEMILALAELGYIPALKMILSAAPPNGLDYQLLAPAQLMILEHHDDPAVQASARATPRAAIGVEATLMVRIRAAKTPNAFRSD